MNEKSGRVKYVDNLRWLIVVLVVIYHVVEVFNSGGGMIHYNAPGIPAIDSIGYAVYPWFMGCLFVLAGMSARYALANSTPAQFAKKRVKRLLVPFAFYMLVFAPLTAAFSFSAVDGWKDFAEVPGVILYLVMTLIGMGHLWFVLELFVISMVFLLINKFDKNDTLWKIGGRFNVMWLLACFIPLFLATQVLNVLGVFRNLFFLLLFLLGYYVFSHNDIMEQLVSVRLPLSVAALVLGGIQMYMYWGRSFSDIVNELPVMLFTWFAILAVLGNAPILLDFSNGFTRFMSKRSILFYICHYFPMILIAYALTKLVAIPILLQYIGTLFLSVVATLVLSEIILRVPFFCFLFGVTPLKSSDKR